MTRRAINDHIVIILACAAILSGAVMRNADSGDSAEKVRIYNARSGRVEEVDKISKPDAEWKRLLTPEEYRVTRQKGTEAPFTGKCEIGKSGGIYACACCGTDLYTADKKFESGTGWPSFWDPVSDLNIKIETDNTLGMQRTEVLCARCGAHLGHVFEDGPPPTHKRYCINAAALVFTPTDSIGK